ncbi:Hypothetical protein FKW44_010901, partial [Caligus rogercresseyi]
PPFFFPPHHPHHPRGHHPHFPTKLQLPTLRKPEQTESPDALHIPTAHGAGKQIQEK